MKPVSWGKGVSYSTTHLDLSYLIAQIRWVVLRLHDVAEREGFEPSMRLPPYRLSKAAH